MNGDSFEARLAGGFSLDKPGVSKVWRIVAIIAIALFVVASIVFTILFFRLTDENEADKLKIEVSNRNVTIRGLEEEKETSAAKITELEKTVESLESKITAQNQKKEEVVKPKPFTVEKTAIIENTKRLAHEIKSNFKIMINSDYSYIVVEGEEKSSGATVYFYKDNTADGEWKYLAATQSAFGCEDASLDIKTILRGLVTCVNNDESIGTF